jgi:hypothetical protein
MVSMKRTFGDTLISIGALATLLTMLVMFDERVREQVAMRFAGRTPSGELADAGHRMRDLASVVIEAARTQSLDHAPLVIFVLASTVLVLFMLRT